MGNTLKLDKKDAVYKLNVLATELSQENGVPFRLKEDMSILEGNTYYDNKGFATKSMIGVSEFTSGNGLRSFLQKRVHDEDFARVVLNMYHESTHVQQKNYIFRQEQLDEILKKQLIQEIACVGNYDYYFNDNGNYRVNASEIQAEKEGIHNAYEYLCDEFPYIDTKEHERIILNIVNNKMMTSSYFVEQSTPFTSLQEVEDAFDEAYDTYLKQIRDTIIFPARMQ